MDLKTDKLSFPALHSRIDWQASNHELLQISRNCLGYFKSRS
ncbi:hypothetical protein TELCIR_04204 [Teladorsagia circumcincta]|uniref:Uncharacterized protein n=1 Tax=Teladorsagia circumcincta TaxID=45464 RepID=A0A2G9UUB0_TELCI|nr:hypothetical protein TELCIR_04204 [Teladorsagia circumcincta]